jgi:hypothetical protein
MINTRPLQMKLSPNAILKPVRNVSNISNPSQSITHGTTKALDLHCAWSLRQLSPAGNKDMKCENIEMTVPSTKKSWECMVYSIMCLKMKGPQIHHIMLSHLKVAILVPMGIPHTHPHGSLH